MSKIFCLTLILVIGVSNISATAQPGHKGLKKGDHFLDIKMKDRAGNDILLSSDNGRLLIIDFWNVNCMGCANAFLKLDSLKRQFKDAVNIVSVTYNNNEQVEGYFKKLKRSLPAYPLIVDDTLLQQMFPHEGDPYCVWVKDGKVIHLSYAFSMTASNVRSVLAGKKISLIEKLSLPEYKWDQSILSASMPMKKYRLLLYGLEEYSVPSGQSLVIDSVSFQPVYLKAVNKTRLELLLQAFWKDVFGFAGNFYNAPNYQVFLDSSAVQLKPAQGDLNMDEWRRQNNVSLELKIDPEEGTGFYKEMQAFLLEHFPFEVELRAKELPAILIEVADAAKFNAIQVNHGERRMIAKKRSTVIQHVSINESLVYLLTTSALGKGKLPYVNNTGYNGLISVRIDGDIYDEINLTNELQKMGLRLRRSVHPLQTMTIRKR
ncbi:MAG: redoxin domain-containing protein [Chitinophagaceae bacterium]